MQLPTRADLHFECLETRSTRWRGPWNQVHHWHIVHGLCGRMRWAAEATKPHTIIRVVCWGLAWSYLRGRINV